MPRRNRPKGKVQRSKYSFKAEHHLVSSTLVARCVTGKFGFPEHVAQAKLEAYQKDGRPNTPTRIYKCDKCPSWHLTSQAKRS